MPAFDLPASSSADNTSRLSRLAVVAMLAVLLAHAVLVAWLFVRAREGSMFELETGEFATVEVRRIDDDFLKKFGSVVGLQFAQP